MDLGKNIVLVAIAVVAVLLQLMLAPYIAIAGAVPNFVAVAAILVAVVRHDNFGCALPFVLGLLYDLFSGAAVGPMAFSLLLASFLAARLYEALNNDQALMALLVVAAALLLTEVLYGVLMLMLGFAGGAAGALALRALPVFVYDLVLAAVLYPLVKRLVAVTSPVQSAITRLR